MLNNMLYWRNSAVLGRRIEDMVTECSELPLNEKFEALSKLQPEFIEFRKNSQSCAVDAAPYVHPRLAAIQVDSKSNSTLTIINDKMTPTEASESYARLRQTPADQLMQELGLINAGSED